MTDERPRAPVIEARLRDLPLPDIPEQLSAERIWRAAEARRQTRNVAMRSSLRVDWAAAPALVTLTLIADS